MGATHRKRLGLTIAIFVVSSLHRTTMRTRFQNVLNIEIITKTIRANTMTTICNSMERYIKTGMIWFAGIIKFTFMRAVRISVFLCQWTVCEYTECYIPLYQNDFMTKEFSCWGSIGRALPVFANEERFDYMNQFVWKFIKTKTHNDEAKGGRLPLYSIFICDTVPQKETKRNLNKTK